MLVVTKSGPATMNLGVPGAVRRSMCRTPGSGDAWNVTIRRPATGRPERAACATSTPEMLSVTLALATRSCRATGYIAHLHRFAQLASSRSRARCRRADRPGRASDRHLPDPSSTPTLKNGATLTNVAGAIAMVQRRHEQHRSPDLHAPADQRHGRHARPSGRAHRYGGTARATSSRRPLRTSQRRRTRRQLPLRATHCATRCACRPRPSRSITLHVPRRAGCAECTGRVRAGHAHAGSALPAGRGEQQQHERRREGHRRHRHQQPEPSGRQSAR